MIPLRWEEIEALALGRLDGRSAGSRGRPHRRRLAGSVSRRPLRRVEHRDAARRRRPRARRRDARPRRSGARARRPRLARPLEEPCARVVAVVGSAGKTTTKDVLAALCAPHARTHRRRAEPEQRDRAAAHRLPARARHRDPRHRDGHARARPDRRALRDRATRTSSSCRTSARSTSSSSARSRTSRPRTPRRSPPFLPGGTAVVPARSSHLEPHLTRDDIAYRRFDAVRRHSRRPHRALPHRRPTSSSSRSRSPSATSR